MPVIRITSTPMSKEQKRTLVAEMTTATMEILGTPEASHMVIIEEIPVDAIGMGKVTVEEMIEQQKGGK